MVYELCPYCETEVKLKDLLKHKQKCPSCGMMIRACSLCDNKDMLCVRCDVENKRW